MKKLIIEAFALSFNKNYGYQEFLLNILDYMYNNIDQLNYEQIIIVSSEENRNVFSKYLPKFNFRGFNYNSTIKKYYILSTLKSRLDLKSDDVILFTNNYSSMFKYCKHALVIHDLLYLRKELFNNPGFRLQRKIFMPRSVKLADVVITISNFVKEDVIKAYGERYRNKINTVYNYFNFDKYTSEAPNIKMPSNKYFLIVSSSYRYKNILLVLEAFVKYARQKEGNLVIVGSLRDEALLYYKAMDPEIAKRILFYKNISNPELGELYKNSMAFITATRHEGLGMPIVEAMYFKTRVFASDIPVCREVSGDLEHYFNPDNKNELAELMINADRMDNSDNISFISSRYSALNTVQKYIDILNNL